MRGLDTKIIEKFLRGKSRKDVIIVVLYIVSLPAFIAFWWLLASYLQDVEKIFYLPTPSQTWDGLMQTVTMDPGTGKPLFDSIIASMRRFLVGFLIALGVAVPLGLLTGFSKYVGAFTKPIIEFLRPIPPIAWVPFLFIALGFFWGPVITIFIGAFFPILSNVFFGVKSVDPLLVDVARTQGASKGKVFIKVVLPFSVPFIMTGVRIGVGIGWMCIVAAEFIASQGGGVGAMIVNAQSISRYDIMFAAMIVVGILGIMTYWVALFAERRVSHWMGN